MKTQREIVNVVNEYSDAIVKLAISYIKDVHAAEDIAQDVIYKYMTYEKNFDSPAHEKAWLLRVTINSCKKYLRSFWISKRTDFDFTVLKTEDSYGIGSDIFEKMMTLPPKYRTALHLFYYEDYSTAEIASIMNKNENTILSYLHRGRKALKEILVKENGYE